MYIRYALQIKRCSIYLLKYTPVSYTHLDVYKRQIVIKEESSFMSIVHCARKPTYSIKNIFNLFTEVKNVVNHIFIS